MQSISKNGDVSKFLGALDGVVELRGCRGGEKSEQTEQLLKISCSDPLAIRKECAKEAKLAA